MSNPPPPPPHRSTNPLSHLVQTILSYDGNVMLAALISLLLVILFVLLLHIYAKWFLAQARHRRRSSVSISRVLGPPRPRFHHFHTFTVDTALSSPTTKGLHPSVIASIPLFVYHKSPEPDRHRLECIICLSLFESQDVGRKLRKCGHAFHADCIDMWLHSHSNCPICRAPATYDQSQNKNEDLQSESLANGEHLSDQAVAGYDHEVGMASCEPALEIVIDQVPTSVEEEIGTDGSLTACSSSSSLSSQASSLKRMLSRSRSEIKVHPSSLVNESSLQ